MAEEEEPGAAAAPGPEEEQQQRQEEAEAHAAPPEVPEAAVAVAVAAAAEGEAEEKEGAPAAPVLPEAPGDEAAAEAADGSPPSAEAPPPAPEEEAQAEAGPDEEKPEEVAPGEPPPASEGPAAAPEEEQPEPPPPPGEEEPPPPPSEEAAPGAEGPAEEPRGEEAAAAEEEAGEGAPEVALRAPSSTLLVDELPTSASFAEGELLEPPPLQIGVDLGRRTSLSLRELEQKHRSGGTPVAGSSPESEEAEAAEREAEERLRECLAEEKRRREELTEEYRQLQAERRHLRHYNAKLQGKLAELMNKGKGKEQPRAELEQHISDREQRYNRYLAMLEELRNQQASEAAWYQKQIDALQGSCSEKLGKVHAEWRAYQAVKKEVAVFTMGRRLGGRQAAIKEVDQIQAREQSKEQEMTEVRIEYIKLKHRIQKLETSLKAQEELAEGLHLIDFEQLKIENQTYNEKIEERNEELLKLRRKITNTVQIISQIKEKLQFVEAENQGQKAQLMAVEALVAQRREILTKTKQARDQLRMDNERLQEKCGLLGHTILLRDFENKVCAVDAMREQLEILKRRHGRLHQTCKEIKKKLQGVSSFSPFI